jgi:acyl-CoA dehydrogenase
MNGAMAEVLALLIDYVNTRSQFGRPIGRFQAVQHLIADIAGELLASEAVLSDALHKPDDRLAWLSAKIQAGRAATAVAAAGHQLFGAIGFTAEHVLHRYTKRLWAWRDEWGRQGACERNVGEMAMMSGESGLWSFLVDRPEGIAGHG